MSDWHISLGWGGHYFAITACAPKSPVTGFVSYLLIIKGIN